MSLTDRELWTVIHGMGLGALFLLAFAGGLAGHIAFIAPILATAVAFVVFYYGPQLAADHLTREQLQ